MVQGLDRREGTQDANAAARAADAGSVPIPQPMSPRNSSFTGVGQNKLEGLLKLAGGLVDSYIKKEQDQSVIDGKLAYTQNVSESELFKSGNRYTVAGYMSMKAHTGMEMFKQQAIADIENSDHALNPDEYRAKLSSTFSQLSESIAKGDAYTRNLLVAQAEEIFPQLMAQQVKSNNDYRLSEHKSSFENALSVAKSPDEAKRVLTGMGQELPKDIRLNSIANVAERASKEGDINLVSTLATLNTKPITNPDPSSLLHVIKKGESGGDYTAVYHPTEKKSEPALTSMTVDQVLQYQEGLISQGAKSAAIGAYQFTHGTLQDAKNKLGLTGSEVFNEQLQDKLAVAKLQERGWNDYVVGKLSFDGLVHELSKEWAALPKDSSGAGYHDKDGLNKANIHYGEMQLALAADVTGNQATQAMIDAGFKPEDIARVKDAYRGAQAANSNKWDIDRTMAEESISSTARLKGNLQESLKQINDVKQQFGLSDAWANQQVNAVQSGIVKYQEEQKKMQEIDIAIARGTAGSLSSDKQQTAIDRQMLTLMQQYPAASAKDSPNYAHDRGIVMDQTFKFMYKNNMTDKRIGQQWDTATMGDIVDAKGKVKQPAIEAYNDYRQAIQSTGNPSWVSGQMPERTQNLFLLADSYMNNGTTYSTEEALVAAQGSLATKLPEGKVNSMSKKQLMRTTMDVVDNIVPDIWNAYGLANDQAQYRWQISKESVERAVKDPEIANRIAVEAAKSIEGLPIENKEAASTIAFIKAKNKIIDKSEYIGGSLVYVGDGPTISQQIGSDRQNEANRVLSEYLAVVGPTVWKDWNKTDVIPHSQSWYVDDKQSTISKGLEWAADAANAIANPLDMNVDLGDKIYEKIRGVQDSKVTYNPLSKSLVIYPYRNYDRTHTLEPMIVSLETLKTGNDLLKQKDRTAFDNWAKAQAATYKDMQRTK